MEIAKQQIRGGQYPCPNEHQSVIRLKPNVCRWTARRSNRKVSLGFCFGLPLLPSLEEVERFRMKPFRTTERAGNRTALIVRDPHLVTTTGTGKIANALLRCTCRAVSTDFSSVPRLTQEHPLSCTLERM